MTSPQVKQVNLMLSISSSKILLTILLCGLFTLAAQVAGHDAPIRSVRYSTSSSGSSFLVTGGWDKTLKYWDLRTRWSLLLGFACLTVRPKLTVERCSCADDAEAMAGAVQLPERCYTMDASGDVLVVGTAERKIQLYDSQSIFLLLVPPADRPLEKGSERDETTDLLPSLSLSQSEIQERQSRRATPPSNGKPA